MSDNRPTREECEFFSHWPNGELFNALPTLRILAEYCIALLDENADLKRDKERLELRTGCVKCKGAGYIEKHQPGYTHYETDHGEGCPAYHYKRVPCSTCHPTLDAAMESTTSEGAPKR